MEEILQMSALELSKQIRHGSLSVKEAVEASTEPWFQKRVYGKLDEKLAKMSIKSLLKFHCKMKNDWQNCPQMARKTAKWAKFVQMEICVCRNRP